MRTKVCKQEGINWLIDRVAWKRCTLCLRMPSAA
jgi:hypothetical protein